MPRQGKKKGEPSPRCAYCGLTRAMLYQIAVPCRANNWKPPVISKRLKQKGSKRGVRVINFESLMAHIRNLPDDEIPAGAGEEAGE